MHLQPRTSPQQQGLSSASTIEKISRVKRRMYIQRTPLPRIRRQRPRRPAPLHHILQSVRQCRSNGHIPRCTLDAPYQPLPTRRSERYSRFPLELAGASNVRSSCALSAGVQLHFECSFRVLRSSRQLVHWDTGRPFFLTSKSGRSVWWQLDERCPLMQDSLGCIEVRRMRKGKRNATHQAYFLLLTNGLGDRC